MIFNPLIHRDKDGTHINIGLAFTVPLLQRYMYKHYDPSTDTFRGGIHRLYVRIGSRNTTKWWTKFICWSWVHQSHITGFKP